MILLFINIAVCDDEIFYRKEICKAIEKHDNWKNHTYKLFVYKSGEEIINAIHNGIEIDILFIDLKLGADSLGTDIGIKLKIINPNILIIYISSYDLYYKELVSAEPFDFIYKPGLKSKIKKVLDRAIMRISYLKHDFIYKYKFNGVLHYISLHDVYYFESQHRIINMFCINGVHQFYDKLDNIEKEIDEIYPCFLCANKSYYINFNYIINYTGSLVALKGDLEIKISKKYKESFDEKYEKIILTWYT